MKEKKRIGKHLKSIGLVVISSATLLFSNTILAEEFSFTILHTNDMHGRMQYDEKNKSIGLARLKTLKDQINPTLMLDAGDSVQGLPISNNSKGIEMAKGMTMIPYDATTAGNHEFDFGYDQAMKLKEYTPLVSANVYKNGQQSFDPYKIIEKDGKKFAIIGLTTPETTTKTHPNNIVGVTFDDPIPTAEKYMEELKGKADIFIFLSHLGVDATTPVEWQSRTLAKELSKSHPTDKIVIIDGHSHTELPNGEKYGNVLLAQTGNYLNNVGEIEAKYSDTDSSINAKLIPFSEVKDLPADQNVDNFVNQVSDNFNKNMSEVVLEGNTINLEGTGAMVRTRETNLGNLIGDALYQYGQTGFTHESDLAIINGGGVRQSIKEGTITKGDILSVLPFGNTISQIEVNGQQLYDMFEHSLRSIALKDENGNIILDEKGQPALDRNGGFLQVSSSVKVYFDSNLQGEVPEENTPGQRVLKVQILNRQSKQFEDVNLEKTYYLTTNDFLAAGGDGYTMLGGTREEGPSMDEVFTNYLKYEGKISEDRKEPFPYERIIPIKKEVLDYKDNAIKTINELSSLDDDSKASYIGKIQIANSVEEINKILAEAKLENRKLEVIEEIINLKSINETDKTKYIEEIKQANSDDSINAILKNATQDDKIKSLEQELAELKEKTSKEINDLRNLNKKQKDEFTLAIKNSISKDEIDKIVNNAVKKNKAQDPQNQTQTSESSSTINSSSNEDNNSNVPKRNSGKHLPKTGDVNNYVILATGLILVTSSLIIISKKKQ